MNEALQTKLLELAIAVATLANTLLWVRHRRLCQRDHAELWDHVRREWETHRQGHDGGVSRQGRRWTDRN